LKLATLNFASLNLDPPVSKNTGDALNGVFIAPTTIFNASPTFFIASLTIFIRQRENFTDPRATFTASRAIFNTHPAFNICCSASKAAVQSPMIVSQSSQPEA
jgi:hypothetical protein